MELRKATYTAAEVEAIKAALLASRPQAPVNVRLNPTGTISVTGLGRWPVSLYKSQWARILEDTTLLKIRTAMASAPDKA